MCAGKMVRFIKKCLRGEESTGQSDVLTNGPLSDDLYTVHLTDGSSIQTSRRTQRTSGRMEKKKNRGLTEILQSQNICSINASSYSKDPYRPLLDVVSDKHFPSQPDIFLDSKGSGLSSQPACRTHPQYHHLDHSRTNLRHLPYHQVSLFSRSPEVTGAQQPFSQKHLHHLFPASVRRSMDGEGVDSAKRRNSPARCEGKITGPPPNRTVSS